MQFIGGMPINESIEDLIYDLKGELAGSDLLKDIKPTGNNIMVTCPIHADGMENKPSCGVVAHETTRHNGTKLEAGTANCFTCGYIASFPEFISNVLGYNDKGRQGFKWLAQNYQFVDVEQRQPINIVPRGTMEQTKSSIVPESELATYRFTHPYMYRRGLTDMFIDIFDIGYCSKTDSITFPIKNEKGECMFIQKRSVQGKRFENDANASKATLFGIDVLKNYSPNTQEIVIVESPLDVITLWQWNIPALGTMQAIPTAEQLEIIDNLPARTIILAQDNDRAGDVGATRMRDKLNKLTLRLKYPEGKSDVNEMTEAEYIIAEKDMAFESVRNMNE